METYLFEDFENQFREALNKMNESTDAVHLGELRDIVYSKTF